MTVMVWLALAVLPHASMAVQVRVTVLVLPQPLTVVSAELSVAVPHVSPGVGVLNTGSAGHWIVCGPPTPLMVGGVVSMTVIVWLAWAVLPHASMAVQVRVTVLVLPQPLTVVSAELSVAVPHVSPGVGVLNTGSAGHWIVCVPPTPLMVGGVVSITVIVWLAWAVLPHASMAVQVRVTVL